jgi:exopolysaccharide biosynthesis polyprenyl glycosylphosphotransferase
MSQANNMISVASPAYAQAGAFTGYVPTAPSLVNDRYSREANRLLKRAFDIAFSMAVMVLVFSWLYPIIALLIKLDSKGPVLFKQYRHGLNNKQFYCYKFRTMVVNQEADSKQATKNDSRITKVGAFLRKTSLDEIPQFFNVILGDMSVVGPRPHPIPLNMRFAHSIEGFMNRHSMKPGVTGLAQIRGYRGETAKFHDMKGRFMLDRFYIANWSLWLDIKIVFGTVWSLVKGDENAY